jgi:hypothetical protein
VQVLEPEAVPERTRAVLPVPAAARSPPWRRARAK